MGTATRKVVIASTVGLHARPAALFVQAASATEDVVTVGRSGDEPVDATSILAVMGLGAKHGEEVELTANGDSADQTVGSLADLLATNLDTE